MCDYDMNDPRFVEPRVIESFKFVLWKLGLADTEDVDAMYVAYWNLVKIAEEV